MRARASDRVLLARAAVLLPLEDIGLREVVQDLARDSRIVVAGISEDLLIRVIDAEKDRDVRRCMRDEAAGVRMVAAVAAARCREERLRRPPGVLDGRQQRLRRGLGWIYESLGLELRIDVRRIARPVLREERRRGILEHALYLCAQTALFEARRIGIELCHVLLDERRLPCDLLGRGRNLGQ